MRLVLAALFLIFQAVGQSTTGYPPRRPEWPSIGLATNRQTFGVSAEDFATAKTVHVRSYVRKDGTVVQAHTRAAPGTGTAPRSTAGRHAFQAQQPCPSTGGAVGACPGYVVDHVRPLACGGADSPENMQWQTVAEAKAKDRWERNECGRPTITAPSAFSAEPSRRSRVAVLPRRGERRDHRNGNRRTRSGRSLRRQVHLGLGISGH
jgi:hypothetical protein